MKYFICIIRIKTSIWNYFFQYLKTTTTTKFITAGRLKESEAIIYTFNLGHLKFSTHRGAGSVSFSLCLNKPDNMDQLFLMSMDESESQKPTETSIIQLAIPLTSAQGCPLESGYADILS